MGDQGSVTVDVYHVVKLDVHYFDDVYLGKKSFELRENDRNYGEGDFVFFTEWDSVSKFMTGRRFKARIGYVLHPGHLNRVPEGFVIFSVEAIEGIIYG